MKILSNHFLENSNFDVNGKHRHFRQTALFGASEKVHEKVVKVLLENSKIDVFENVA